MTQVLTGYVAFLYYLVPSSWHLWKVAGADDGVPVLWVSPEPLGCLVTCPGCGA